MLILGWHLWLASKSSIQNGCTRITYYRQSTLSQKNWLTKTPTRQLSISYTKNYAGKKKIKFVNKFAENFKLHDDLPQNSYIHHTDLNFDKRAFKCAFNFLNAFLNAL